MDVPFKPWMAGDIRPQKGAWAPGKYCNKCCQCGEHFIGDKRAGTCSACAYGDNDAIARMFADKNS